MKYLLCFFLTGCISSYSHSSWQELGKDKIPTEQIFKHKGVIWGFDFLSPNEIIFSKRDGKLFYYNFIQKKFQQLKAPSVWAQGQGGLLDVLIVRGSKAPTVYFTYSKPTKKTAVTALAKGKWDGQQLQELSDIFISNAYSKKSYHFGSRLLLRGDELFMTVGERGERKEAQNLNTHHGSVLRLTLDGKAYPDNPLKAVGLPEIYSYGHRNPQGIALGLDGTSIFECEFGPRGGDEINLLKPGKNYGWPVITYGSEYYGPKIGKEKKAGMQQPLVYYTPSISPSGMVIYSGKLNKKLKGNFFLAALGSEYIHRLVFDENLQVKGQQRWLPDLKERIRQIREGPDGNLYFSTDSGEFYKIDMNKIKVD